MPQDYVKIHDVRRLADGDSQLAGYGVGSPVPGKEAPGRVFNLAGWFLNRDGVPGLSAEVYVEDQLIVRIPVNLGRPDVAKRFRFGTDCVHCGFGGYVGTLGLRPSFDVEVRALLADKKSVPMLRIHGEQQLITVPYRAKRQPLAVTALGRSGTTWVCHLLAQHTEILAARGYPYEVRAGQYWMHALQVLGAPANHHESTHPDLLGGTPFWVGHNPYFHPDYLDLLENDWELSEWYGEGYIADAAGFFQKQIDIFYDHVQRIQKKKCPGRYYVEKTNPSRTPPLFDLTYPEGKEIFLVRDFRDMVCSQIAFNKKRGFLGFGRDHYSNDTQWLEFLARAANRMATIWTQRREHAFLIRYEDLVRSPVETLSNVFSYLDIANSPEVVKQVVSDAADGDIFAEHRTTRNAESSIGRWKYELNNEWKEMMQTLFKTPARLFGYVD